MPTPPPPDDPLFEGASYVTDADRLGALRRYDILDTAPEEAFDRLTRLAAHLFDAPLAIVNFVTGDRQWFKSAVGTNERETGLDISICVYTVGQDGAVGQDGVFVVEDLADDARFADNPFIADEGLRFYAGAPLVTPDGHRLGTLCVLDTEPRSLSEADTARLADLAEMVMDELELRRETAVRERLAEQLRRSRHLLRQSQRLAHVGGWEYDLRAEALTWTDETYRIHDLPVGSDISVDEAIDYYLPKARAVIRTRFRAIVEEGGTYELELPIRTASGERRWVRTIGEAHQEEGETVRVSGAIQDITDERRAQQRRREQSEVLTTVFENVPVLLALFDEDGRLSLMNRQFRDTLGWSKEDLDDPPNAISLFYPDPEARSEAWDFIREAPGDWRDFRVQGEDGAFVDLRGRVVALPDGRRIGIGVDVTDRKEREEQLRLLEAAVEHTRLPVLLTEAAPLDEPGPRVMYANPAFTDVTGYEREEIRGRSPRILQGPDTDPEALARIRRALEADEPVREIVRNYTKDGTPYWNDLYIAPVRDGSGTVTHYVSVQDDVTERVRRREELERAKEEAEEAARVKSALLTNMSHELRTPLTSIISFGELLASSPELADTFAERIVGGGKRLLRTLNTVMDFAELEAGTLTPAPVAVDLRDVVRGVAGDVRDEAARKDLALEVDTPDTPVRARLDKHLVERICVHLVDNAVKFTESGTVTIGVREEDGPDRGGDDGRLRGRNPAPTLWVEDTGVGIAPDFLPRATEEFTQASTGNDRTHDGNGLGLTIVEGLVHRMGGTLDIESEPGHGTLVTVRLPAQPP
jgi:PAS domain S-box-containing protein